MIKMEDNVEDDNFQSAGIVESDPSIFLRWLGRTL